MLTFFIMKLLLSVFILLFAGHSYGDSLKILFLGDTYFGESYQTNPGHNDGVNIIEEYGYDYFFENVKILLAESDYIIANLETSLFQSNEVKYLRKPYSHWSYGEKTCHILSKYKINCVSLGNNHVMDYGPEGLNETIRHLDSNNISYFGAGFSRNEAVKPLVKLFYEGADTFRLAIIGGFEDRPNYDTLYNFYATEDKPGVNKINTHEVVEQVKILKEQYKDIFIVFFPHWGKNYKPVMDYQKEIAHNLINSGVDLIIGHGAHTIQETEEYKGKFILYNIGNFIFNAPGRYESTGAKPFGYMAQLVTSFRSSKKWLRVYPVFTNNLKSNYQLRFFDEDESDEFYKNTFIGKNNVLIRTDFIQLTLN